MGQDKTLEDKIKDSLIQLRKNIKQRRRELRYTQFQLAEKAGMSGNCIAYIERGILTPLLKTLYKISYFLSIDPGELFSENYRPMTNEQDKGLEAYIKNSYTQLRKNIKQRRKELRYTQFQLAEKVNKTENYVVFIETGRRQPSLKTLHKIAYALDMEPGLLVSGHYHKPTN